MTGFFGHLFLINFAVGVVTGIVQEFQFGMNWSEFSFFVGNIFGVPLALEVLMAFFLESTFIGLWWFGKDRLKPWMRLASIWLVAIGTQISAFWIVLANAWMHHPVGYEVVDGQARLTDFAAVVFNYKAWLYFAHVQGSAWVVAAFFVLGISAFHLLRRQDTDVYRPPPATGPAFAATRRAPPAAAGRPRATPCPLRRGQPPAAPRRSLRIGLVFAAIGTVFSVVSGHTAGQVAREDQPMKLAAMGAQWGASACAARAAACC